MEHLVNFTKNHKNTPSLQLSKLGFLHPNIANISTSKEKVSTTNSHLIPIGYSFIAIILFFKDLKIWHSRVPNLTWTHFRHLLRVDDEKARLWYMNEAANQLWSTRELERNINTQYYFRLLANQKDKTLEVVDIHAGEPTLPEKDGFIKNPVVAEFLGLKPDRDIPERNLEDAIIHHIEKFLMELGKGYALVDRQKHIPSQIHALYAN